MYPNLLGQKAYHKLTDAEMAEVHWRYPDILLLLR